MSLEDRGLAALLRARDVSGASQELAALPSATTAYRLVQGDLSAWPNLLRDLIGRTFLVGVGVKLAGASWKETLKYGFSGALGIEAFVLTYAAWNVATARPTGTSTT